MKNNFFTGLIDRHAFEEGNLIIGDQSFKNQTILKKRTVVF